MSIAIVVVTHNRLEYTKKMIPRLLEDPTEEFDLYIWDNDSKDGTRQYLESISDPRLIETIFNKENTGPTGAMNYVWNKTKAELVGKVDNDCLMTPGWTRTLAQAHKDIEKLGAVACWHFLPEDFDENAARRLGKIQTFGNHSIFRHPWICGTGFLMKRKTFLKYGQFKTGPSVGATYYFLNMAYNGQINGWYYPFILQEHMDDPKSSHCLTNNDQAIQDMKEITYVLREHKVNNMQDNWNRRALILKNFNYEPWEAKHYVGWRRKWWLAKIKIRNKLKL